VCCQDNVWVGVCNILHSFLNEISIEHFNIEEILSVHLHVAISYTNEDWEFKRNIPADIELTIGSRGSDLFCEIDHRYIKSIRILHFKFFFYCESWDLMSQPHFEHKDQDFFLHLSY